MAISTYKVFLMHKASSEAEYKKLINIKSFPDLGGEPEMLETTTLSDAMQTFIAGIQTLDALKFEANYTKTDYDKINALNGEQDFAVWFGGTGKGESLTPTGEAGKYNFKGEPSVYITGGAVNEVVKMNISIAPSTPITPAE